MENNELELVQEVNSHVTYLQDKAAIDVQISTAKAYPRNIKRSLENAIAVATMDIATAQTCTYSVPRGGKTISGPSVHLAKILAQCWGNIRIESKVVDIDQKQVTSEGVCFDLENNLAIKTQVKRSIVSSKGMRYNDDMITVTGNAGNAVALRNAILAVIPRAIVDKVYNAAKSVITGDISDNVKFLQRRKQVFDGIHSTYGLSEAEILFPIGKAAIDHVTADDLVVLIGIGQAIKDGDTTIDDAFKRVKNIEEEKPKAPKAKAQEASLLSDDDISKLIEMVRSGDMTASLQAKKGYSLTITQLSDLQDAEDFYNSQTHTS